MDTRFWGPSGWELLHLIASAPWSPKDRRVVEEWLALTEYVLPCKYCRSSFHDYLLAQPLTDDTPLSRWMYDIHNRVNGKLRGQGLLTAANPSWPSVRARYEKRHRTLCRSSEEPVVGWEFLSSIAFSAPSAKPVPMPDTPEDLYELKSLSFADRNRYNLLSPAERRTKIRAWWSLLPSVLPCAAWRTAWRAAAKENELVPPRSRDAAMRWMWRMEESVCSHLRCPTPHSSCSALERECARFESRCSTAKRGVTCRKQRRKQQRQRKTRRRD